MTREERRYAQQLMVKLFKETIAEAGKGKLYWTGTKIDLIELAYEVFTSGMVTDSAGRPYTFIDIVSKTFASLHVSDPSNPYSTICKAHVRKGVRQQSFFSRFCFMVFNGRRKNPLNAMIVCVEPK